MWNLKCGTNQYEAIKQRQSTDTEDLIHVVAKGEDGEGIEEFEEVMKYYIQKE